MSVKVIIEEDVGDRVFRMAASQLSSAASFAVNLHDRGLVQLDRQEAEFVARALRAALDTLAPEMDRVLPPAPPPIPAKAQEPPPRAGKRWEVEEDQKLVAEFKDGVDYRAMAKSFGRTPTAILERLLHHELIIVSVRPSPESTTQ